MKPDQAQAGEIASQAQALFDAWKLDALPGHLKRNALDYYYLSVWPGLLELDKADGLTLPGRPPKTESAYFHIPFCSGRCTFCSYFLAVVDEQRGRARVSSYVDQLADEVAIHADGTELLLSYVYFGGGTPSLVDPLDFDRLLGVLKKRGYLAKALQGTVEVHPEFFRDARRAGDLLDTLSSYGLKRISVGFEAGNDSLLTGTNRRHRSAFLESAIHILRSRQFTINVDVMYGLPEQSIDDWAETLSTVLAHKPDSVSTYCTFIDYGTAMWRSVDHGTLTLQSHRHVQTQHIVSQLMLKAAGYWELPSDFFAIPTGSPSSYRQDTLPSSANSLAIGAGSYGYYPGVQYFNEFHFGRYAFRVKSGEAPIWRAALLDDAEDLRRDVMFSFKNAPCLDGGLFRQRYGIVPWEAFDAEFSQLEKYGLIDLSKDCCKLTRIGRLLVEEIAMLFASRRGGSSDASPAEMRRMKMHNFAPTYGGGRIT